MERYGPGLVRVAVAYHSGGGHTALQAQAVARGAAAVPGTAVDLVDVTTPDDALWATLAGADAVVFGAPTYMGGPSGPFKSFADASAAVWAAQGWRDKVAAGFTNSGHMSGDKLSTLVYLAVLAAQHGMHWVNLGLKGGWATADGSAEDLNRLGGWLGAMAQSNKDEGPEGAPPPSDLRTAEALGRRVAAVSRQLLLGRGAAGGAG
jgi:NAD(P)H dehydrogenase (quinone)